mmetsp:Transcript_35655/g.41275  ORF Transcript_35655/g.41275 Transcript_35655/m.41275 type:complete len:161 (-) Transcript_35655:152-634(-)
MPAAAGAYGTAQDVTPPTVNSLTLPTPAPAGVSGSLLFDREVLNRRLRVVRHLQQHGHGNTPVPTLGAKDGDNVQILVLDLAQRLHQHRQTAIVRHRRGHVQSYPPVLQRVALRVRPSPASVERFGVYIELRSAGFQCRLFHERVAPGINVELSGWVDGE